MIEKLSQSQKEDIHPEDQKMFEDYQFTNSEMLRYRLSKQLPERVKKINEARLKSLYGQAQKSKNLKKEELESRKEIPPSKMSKAEKSNYFREQVNLALNRAKLSKAEEKKYFLLLKNCPQELGGSLNDKQIDADFLKLNQIKNYKQYKSFFTRTLQLNTEIFKIAYTTYPSEENTLSKIFNFSLIAYNARGFFTSSKKDQVDFDKNMEDIFIEETSRMFGFHLKKRWNMKNLYNLENGDTPYRLILDDLLKDSENHPQRIVCLVKHYIPQLINLAKRETFDNYFFQSTHGIEKILNICLKHDRIIKKIEKQNVDIQRICNDFFKTFWINRNFRKRIRAHPVMDDFFSILNSFQILGCKIPAVPKSWLAVVDKERYGYYEENLDSTNKFNHNFKLFLKNQGYTLKDINELNLEKQTTPD